MDDDEAPDDINLWDRKFPQGWNIDPKSSVRLGAADLDWIERELRVYYTDLLCEPVPHRLLALVDLSLSRRTVH